MKDFIINDRYFINMYDMYTAEQTVISHISKREPLSVKRLGTGESVLVNLWLYQEITIKEA